MSDNFLEVGKIVAPQGLNGELRVYPNTDFPERFLEPGQRWLLRPNASQPQPIDLLRGRYLDGKGLYIVQLAGVNDRTQAEALRDCKILIPASDRLPLEKDEFHVADLIGLRVFDQPTQTLIGTVTDVISAGNDLLQVECLPSPEDGKPRTVLIPFVNAIVPIVDLKQQRIEITPPAGLVE
jgi:16S rRNA processing protein RimM